MIASSCRNLRCCGCNMTSWRASILPSSSPTKICLNRRKTWDLCVDSKVSSGYSLQNLCQSLLCLPMLAAPVSDTPLYTFTPRCASDGVTALKSTSHTLPLGLVSGSQQRDRTWSSQAEEYLRQRRLSCCLQCYKPVCLLSALTAAPLCLWFPCIAPDSYIIYTRPYTVPIAVPIPSVPLLFLLLKLLLLPILFVLLVLSYHYHDYHCCCCYSCPSPSPSHCYRSCRCHRHCMDACSQRKSPHLDSIGLGEGSFPGIVAVSCLASRNTLVAFFHRTWPGPSTTSSKLPVRHGTHGTWSQVEINKYIYIHIYIVNRCE